MAMTVPCDSFHDRMDLVRKHEKILRQERREKDEADNVHKRRKRDKDLDEMPTKRMQGSNEIREKAKGEGKGKPVDEPNIERIQKQMRKEAILQTQSLQRWKRTVGKEKIGQPGRDKLTGKDPN